jgi:hypothetical protein
MKTLYTDRYALRLWIWLFFAAFFAFEAVRTPSAWFMAVCIAFAVAFVLLAGFGLKARFDAKRRGEDPSIYRVVDDA